LLNTAVTGKERYYRRQTSQDEHESNLLEGEESGGAFGIQKIIGYLPPWEAWHSEKCGFYQDFYQVLWESPYSEVDYSSVENGCPCLKGSTWEPDECLPSDLDALRLAAKDAWIKKRSEREQKQMADQRAQDAQQRAQGSGHQALNSPPGSIARVSPPPVAALVTKRAWPNEVPVPVPAPAAKRARTRRDGAPLERDLLRSNVGHDFASEGIEAISVHLRSGWPRRPQDYPAGFKAAGPPGFCGNQCDCMDDRRAQQPWETHKAWLEDTNRSAAASRAVQAFAARTEFVWRRGLHSGQSFLQPLSNEAPPPAQSSARAALELAGLLETALKAVLGHIPASALIVGSHPVRIPAAAFLLAADTDYEPLRFSGQLAGGSGTEPLPSWIRLGADDGLLVIKRHPLLAELPLKLHVELKHAEGTAASCGIVSEQPAGSSAPWCMATVRVAQFFYDSSRCPLEPGVRKALHACLDEVYDPSLRQPRNLPLGPWLVSTSRLLRLLRCAASGAAPSTQQLLKTAGGRLPAPRTPTR